MRRGAWGGRPRAGGGDQHDGAASAFQDGRQLLELPPDGIKDASDEARKAEQAADAVLGEARRAIAARQIEAKGKDMSTEVSQVLINFQTRVGSVQGDVAKAERLRSGAEARPHAKERIEEARGKPRTLQGKVATVAQTVETPGEEKPQV